MARHAKKEWHKEAKVFFRQCMAAYDFDVAEDGIFMAAVDQLSRFLQARDRLNVEGLTFVGASGLRAHPCVAAEKTAFKNFLGAMRQLGIKAVPEKGTIGRPMADRGLALL